MARAKTRRSPTAVSLSGPLSHALPRHAEQRAQHFFLFLFSLRAACNLIFDGSGRTFHPADLICEAATHQIDSGLRQNANRDTFDPRDPNVVARNATSFSKIDAAHYCNLGLAGDFATLESLARQDDDALELIDMCKVLAGNTVWLPQQINIGPDRVIDRLHYLLAIDFLEEPEPVFKPQNIGTYGRMVDVAMREYADAKDREGEHGLAACARCYLPPYSNLEAIIGDTVGHFIDAECDARRLDRTRYRGS